MRPFYLQRDTDVSGVSGTGRVAEGIEFSDRTVVIRWTSSSHHSTVVWPGIEAVVAIHGHDGATRVVWLDAEAALCSQCGERTSAMIKIGTTDGWCTVCLDEAAHCSAGVAAAHKVTADELWRVFLRLPHTPSPLGDYIQRRVRHFREHAGGDGS